MRRWSFCRRRCASTEATWLDWDMSSARDLWWPRNQLFTYLPPLAGWSTDQLSAAGPLSRPRLGTTRTAERRRREGMVSWWRLEDRGVRHLNSTGLTGKVPHFLRLYFYQLIALRLDYFFSVLFLGFLSADCRKIRLLLFSLGFRLFGSWIP